MRIFLGGNMNELSLAGKWDLKPEGNIYNIDMGLNYSPSVNFPGDIQTAILEANPGFDPYYRDNELKFQVPGQTYWTCTRTINVPKKMLKDHQFIEFDGIDTFADIFVNDICVGHTENFFRLWRFDITGFLHEGENTIQIKFTPSEAVALEEAKKLSYPIPCSIYDITSPNRNLVRKTQCHAGWDWGPCIMAMGVYNSLKIIQTKTGFIDYIQTRTTPISENQWQVEVTTHIYGLSDCLIPVSVCIKGEGIEPAITGTPVRISVGENVVKHTLTVNNPELWWPAGCRPEDDDSILNTGKPTFNPNTLYDITVTAGEISKTQKLGFRTLKVIAKEDEHGKSLYFKVNGRSIFSKGSNWIPCDALPSRQTPEKYQYLLDSLVKANQNTVRVWGGGFYEKDIFYYLCDLYGILIWQDCMFACSTYPATKEFLENVRYEIRHQVKRLSHHPSLAIWCGNNENLGAITWYEESKNNRDRYLLDYDHLNEGVVGDEVQKNDPDRAWWPSSPSAGPNDFSDNWHADGRGDMHYWSVWHEKKPFEAYYSIKPRFVSEFGYQSLPAFSEIKTFTEPKDLNITSPIMEFHQRSPGGNAIIFENFSRYFRVPITFPAMVYLSQVQQAIAIQTAVQYWRSLRPICMGATVWQINDVWPIASWSSIDYSGKWKLLHYNEKKFFAPVFLSAFVKDNIFQAHVLNDTRKEIPVKVTISTLDFNGNKVKDDVVISQQVSGDSSTKVYELPLEKPVSDSFIYATLEYGNCKIDAAVFTSFQKKCDIENPEISYEIEEIPETNGSFKVTLTSKKPAFYVSLDQQGLSGLFSDNMLTLLPNEPKTVIFTPSSYGNKKTKTVKLGTFKKNLIITSLYESYN